MENIAGWLAQHWLPIFFTPVASHHRGCKSRYLLSQPPLLLEMIVLPSQLWVLRSLLEALLGSCCFPNKKGHTQLAWLLLFLCVPALKADNFCSRNSHLRPWGTKQENESQYADSRMERYKEPQSPMAQLPPYFLEITSRPSFTWKKKLNPLYLNHQANAILIPFILTTTPQFSLEESPFFQSLL